MNQLKNQQNTPELNEGVVDVDSVLLELFVGSILEDHSFLREQDIIGIKNFRSFVNQFSNDKVEVGNSYVYVSILYFPIAERISVAHFSKQFKLLGKNEKEFVFIIDNKKRSFPNYSNRKSVGEQLFSNLLLGNEDEAKKFLMTLMMKYNKEGSVRVNSSLENKPVLRIEDIVPKNTNKRKVNESAQFTGRKTKDGTWRVFKNGEPVAVAGPFKSAEEANAWIKKQTVLDYVEDFDKQIKTDSGIPIKEGRKLYKAEGSLKMWLADVEANGFTAKKATDGLYSYYAYNNSGKKVGQFLSAAFGNSRGHLHVPEKTNEALGLYGPFTVTINTGERPKSKTKIKKFKREDDAILWAEDWFEDFPQYVYATAEITDPNSNVVWVGDENVGTDKKVTESVKALGADQYEYTHGKKPSGQGTWIFCKNKKCNPVKDAKDQDYFQYNGSYTKAKQVAIEWANKMKHSRIYVQP